MFRRIACSLSKVPSARLLVPIFPLSCNRGDLYIRSAAYYTVSNSYAVIVNGEPELSGGTSAAAPVFASVIALLNDARFKAGKPALGFLNPWRKHILFNQKQPPSYNFSFDKPPIDDTLTPCLVYAVGFAGLTDITRGRSVGCNGINGQTGRPVVGGSIIPFASWNATTGWDPVTGLGVPDFERLLALALGS